MKKTYMKPSMEVHGIMTSLPIAQSLMKMSTGRAKTQDEGGVVLSKERGGIFSTTDDGYNRSLW